MITYIKTAFKKPKEIYVARNMKNTHFFYLILLMTLALTILSIFQYVPILNNINEDFNEIKNSIPPFGLTENRLESDSESYIYQTDSMIFYFDPENSIDENIIDENMNRVPVPVSTGILKEGLYINFIGQGYFVAFTEMDNFTADGLKNIIANFGQSSPGIYLIMIILLFIIQFITFLYSLLPIALFANVISIINGVRLKLFQNFKITLLAVIPATLVLTLIQTFITPIRFDFEIILIMSLFIYYISITEMKNRLIHQI